MDTNMNFDLYAVSFEKRMEMIKQSQEDEKPDMKRIWILHVFLYSLLACIFAGIAIAVSI